MRIATTLLILTLITSVNAAEFLPYGPIISIRDGNSDKFLEYESTIFHKTNEYYYAVTSEKPENTNGRLGIKLSHPDNVVFQTVIQVEPVAIFPEAPLYFFRFPNLDWFDIPIDEIKSEIEHGQTLKIKRWSYNGLDHLSTDVVYSETYSRDNWKYTVVYGPISRSWFGCPAYHNNELYGIVSDNFMNRNKKNYGTITPMTKVWEYFNRVKE